MRRIIGITLFAVALGGCHHRREESETVVQNEMQELPAPAPANVTAPPAAPPSNISTNTVVRAAPPPPVDDEVQTREDADASGMTSRLPGADRDAPATAPAANSSTTR